MINSDGLNLKDISKHGIGEWRDPDWFPDGKRVLHLRFLENTFGEEVFLRDTTGSNSKRLTENQINDRSPSISPSGLWIVWSADGDVWLMRSDGEKQQEIVENGTYPFWSPDSKQIVFSRQNSQGSKRVLWVINRDGSELNQITF